MNDVTLYGSSLSLFTGRARSYLIKSGIPYRETTPTTDHFKQHVLPKTGGRQSIPTIELPDGEVIRDGAAIVDYFESDNGHRYSPITPKQHILSLLFDVIGAEGLLRPAMHFRWNFPEKNLSFLRFHFESLMPPHLDKKIAAEKSMNQMRAACQAFGAVPEHFELVETLYMTLLEKLNTHFSNQPYLLGGQPCIGDFGMIAPFFGHLGRDPKPLSLMQQNAVRLFRWTERMNRPELDVGEFDNQDGVYLADDEVPDSLIDVLQHLALDFIPETRAAADCINQWLDQQNDLEPLTNAERGVGFGSFEVQGETISALAQPYRFYLLQRVQDSFEAMNASDQNQVKSMLERAHMADVLALKISRRIGRENNREVWL
tara:strand:+ start:2039 stop:3157 length:1119 start_codon:yes stop_codon:yes gene_type:complete